MTLWTTQHEALLNGLRGDRVIPTLYRRLSRERFVASTADVRRLRDWPASLMRDPGWAALEAALDSPSAWPAAWGNAVDTGFSPRTDHHHALLFSEFVDRFLAAADYEGARYAWREALAAWGRVFLTDYPKALLDDLQPDDDLDVDALMRGLLTPMLEARQTEFQDAARLGHGSDQLDRRTLRFAWDALNEAAALSSSEGESTFGVLEHLRQMAEEMQKVAVSSIVTEFQTRVEGLNLADDSSDEITAPFDWFTSIFDVIEPTDNVVTTLVSEVVDVCWDLRKYDRDDIAAFGDLISLATPFNDRLEHNLVEGGANFGHNSRCADVLVFRGEQSRSPDRRMELFRRGLSVCPGHRNSAMLLSHEYLRKAELMLVETSATPSMFSAIPRANRRAGKTLREAWELVRRAEETYGFNEELPDVRDRVLSEADRLGVVLDDAPPEDGSDGEAAEDPS